MKLKQTIYSNKIAKIAHMKKKGNLKISKCDSYIGEMNVLKEKIHKIYLKSVKPEINKKHDYFSRQLSQSNIQVKKFFQKKLKEENEKYFNRIFSRENSKLYLKSKRKKVELPSISNNNFNQKKEVVNNEIKNNLIKKVKIKILSNAINEGKKTILMTKINKKEIKKKNEIMDEIIIKSKEEQKIEQENKIKEEKEIKEEIEKKEKLKEEIKQKENIEKKILYELKEKNELKNKENKKNLENFHKEQEIINKKNQKEKIKVLNTNISDIKDKNTKYKILKELGLLIKHGAQLIIFNINSNDSSSYSVINLSISFDN